MLSNIKIGKRMGIAFTILLVIMVALIWFGLNGMSGMAFNLERIVKVNNTRLELLNQCQINVSEVSINLRNILLDANMEKRQEYVKRIADQRGKYDEQFNKTIEMTSTDDKKSHELFTKIKEATEAARGFNKHVTELALAGKDAEAVAFMNRDARPAVRKWLTLLDELIAHNTERNKIRYEGP